MKSVLPTSARLLVAAAAAGVMAQQTPYSIDNTADIKQTASDLAYDMMTYYSGNLTGQTPGILPGPPPAGPYYWWEGGAMWGTLIDYWFYTGDTTYNDEVMQAMLHQVGENGAYMPRNYTISLGNDDQGFWGLSAMLAAENDFPNPPKDQPQWLELAQAVWNTQASPDRHDSTCGGGLRWQIPPTNQGYDYKNSIANGIFFNMGARLARYTANDSYAQWAEKTWDWMWDVNFIDHETYAVYDGAHVEDNCTDVDKAEFSYNNAVLVQGAAFMFNYTNGSAIWEDRINKLLTHGVEVFFPKGIAYEPSCEPYGSCTSDMFTYKGYVARWWTMMQTIAPFTAAVTLPVLKTSVDAAIKECTGAPRGRACGFHWTTGAYDGQSGAGQEMDVLGAVSVLLCNSSKAPVTARTGGSSTGDPDAGQGADSSFEDIFGPVTTADRAGAGILTFLLLASTCCLFAWMSVGK